MNVFTTDKIRNVVLLGHAGAGKTLLSESMAFLSGEIEKPGTIENGNTINDFTHQEKDKKCSIHTSLMPIIWNDVKINILDAPGAYGFSGEMEEAVAAADAAIIVVSGKSGVEVGTLKAWNICEKYHLPRMFYVTHMDIDDASFKSVVEELTERYGKIIAPFHFPIREYRKFVGYINVISSNAYRFIDNNEAVPSEIPEYSKENLKTYNDTLMESVAETSEEFMDRYFSGDTFSEDEIRSTLRVNVLEGSIIPISMGSNYLHHGTYTLLDDIVKYFPSPDKRECTGIDADSNEVYYADYDFSLPKSAYVWKTMVDPFMGKNSFIKVNSGVLKTDDLLFNKHKDKEFKIGKLYTMFGKKLIEVKELHAGDIGVLSKINSIETTDSLSTKKKTILYIRTAIKKPYTCMAYHAKKKDDEDKVADALQKIMQEDKTLEVKNDSELHQTLLYGISKQHIDSVVYELKDRYKVEIELSRPKTSFRETIKGISDVEYKYKKQSGGHGQYGHVKMKFSPSGNLESSYEFTESIVGGAVPKNFFPAVEKGIKEGVKEGPLAGYPVLGVKCELYDGSYHPVDSSEQSFYTASLMCFKKGIMEATPILLEPIALLSVLVLDDMIGDVMGDLNKRRGRVLQMNSTENGIQEITAEIPYEELIDYGTVLRSMTGGFGEYSYTFLRYDPATSEITEREVEKVKQKKEDK